MRTFENIGDFHREILERLGDEATPFEARQFGQFARSCGIETTNTDGKWLAFWESLEESEWQRLLEAFNKAFYH